MQYVLRFPRQQGPEHQGVFDRGLVLDPHKGVPWDLAKQLNAVFLKVCTLLSQGHGDIHKGCVFRRSRQSQSYECEATLCSPPLFTSSCRKLKINVASASLELRGIGVTSPPRKGLCPLLRFLSLQCRQDSCIDTLVPGFRIKRIIDSYRVLGPFSIDLAGAVMRQSSFIDEMVKLSWTDPHRFDDDGTNKTLLERAISRYHAFIGMIAASPKESLVPTLVS